MKNKLIVVLFLFSVISLSARDFLSPEQEWLDALEKDNSEKAIACAEKIITPPFSREIANPLYVQIFKEVGIPAHFLDDDFCRYDFILWKHALFFRKKAIDIKKSLNGKGGETEILNALLGFVKSRIKPEERKYSAPLWPYNILERGFGLCDRQCSVFCELAYQLDFETSIIFLTDPETGISPHTICEIRSEKKVWIVDVLNAFLLEDTSLVSLIDNKKLISEKWPSIPVSAFEYAFVMIPSYPQDYCLRNQLLYLREAETLKEKCPRFGSPPKIRQLLYTSLILRNYIGGKGKNWKYGFFGNHLLALKDEMSESGSEKGSRKSFRKK